MPSAEKHDGRSEDRPGRTWRKPRLTVHGDLRTLTQAKGGTSNDGGGKPSTRASGKWA